jgi:hypothetical protein
MATTEIIKCHYTEFVGIYRFTGADIGIPPTGALVIHAVIASGMVMAGQRMTDKDCITVGGIKPAIGFVDQIVLVQGFTASQ